MLTRSQRSRVRRQRDALERMAGTEEGRTVLRMVLDLSGVYAPSTVAEGPVLAFEAGKRAVGLALIEALTEIDPSLVVRMMADAANEITISRATREGQQDD